MTNEYYDEAISFEGLYVGLKKSCRNVRWKDSVVGYENNGLKNTLSLREHLIDGTYKISKYQVFEIFEPKQRTIVASRLVDRQFQRSLCDAGLYKDITEHFVRDNVACQIGKGTDDAINRLKIQMQKFYRKHGVNGWALKCDIHHFFPETRHDIAKAAVMKYVSDKNAARAVCNVIDSFSGEKGIGLGSQISQLVELLVLNDLDHFIKERLKIKCYIRYMDDFVLIHESKEYLQECRKLIENELHKIGLELNKKTSLYPLKQGVKFLRWKFRITETGKVLLLMDKEKLTKQKRRMKKLWKKEIAGEVEKGTTEDSLKSWMANAQRGNTYHKQMQMYEFYKNMTGGIQHERKISSKESGRGDGGCCC